MHEPSPKLVWATAVQPGAVALLQLQGRGQGQAIRGILAKLTGQEDWPLGRLRLSDFAGIDTGLAVLLTEQWAQIMPHGGPRVVRKLIDHLLLLGAVHEPEADPRRTYPEAADEVEAAMLAAMARAASPAAIDVLVAQPALWRTIAARLTRLAGDADRRQASLRAEGTASPHPRNPAIHVEEIIERSDVLDRLITPPSVVVVGRPNVGKSTLTNVMLGRALSIVADLPGTTRDWVAGLAELAGSDDAGSQGASDIAHRPPGNPHAAIAVRWTDTPGLRTSDDAVEREAIAIARQVLIAADVLIAMRDPETDWPEPEALPRSPDLYVVNKVDHARKMGGDTAGGMRSGGVGDTGARSPAAPLPISAAHDRNLDVLQQRIIAVLGLANLDPPPLWAFSPRLRRQLHEMGLG